MFVQHLKPPPSFSLALRFALHTTNVKMTKKDHDHDLTKSPKPVDQGKACRHPWARAGTPPGVRRCLCKGSEYSE